MVPGICFVDFCQCGQRRIGSSVDLTFPNLLHASILQAAKCLGHLEGLLRSNGVKSDTFRAALSESLPELASTADAQQNGGSDAMAHGLPT